MMLRPRVLGKSWPSGFVAFWPTVVAAGGAILATACASIPPLPKDVGNCPVTRQFVEVHNRLLSSVDVFAWNPLGNAETFLGAASTGTTRIQSAGTDWFTFRLPDGSNPTGSHLVEFKRVCGA